MKSCHPRRILILLSALLFVYGFYMGGLQFAIADVSASFGMQITGIGILVSVPHITSLFLPMFLGVLSDRIGKKKILMLFAGIFVVGCLIAGLSGALAVYIVGALLVSGGHSVCESVATAVLSDLDPKQAARNINISQGLLSAGAVIGPVLMQWLMRSAGADWRFVFLASGAGFAVLMVLMAVSVFPQAQPSVKVSQKKHKIPLFGSGVLICALISMMLYVSLEKGIGYFTESFFTQELRREDLGAYAISLYWIGMTVSRFVLSVKMEHLRRSLIAHFTASAVLFLILYLTKVPHLALATCCLIGFAFGPIWSALVARGTQQFPEHSGAVSGLMSSCGSLGSIVAPVLMGVISDSLNIRSGFLLMTAFAALSLVLTIVSKSNENVEKTA